MKIDWERWSQTAGWAVADGRILVELPDGRRHKVAVQVQQDVVELSAIVARGSQLTAIEDAARKIWRRNRSAQRVGFRVDRHGRIVGESWSPRAGLTADEFRSTVRHLAAECDRMEMLLTGTDLE